MHPIITTLHYQPTAKKSKAGICISLLLYACASTSAYAAEAIQPASKWLILPPPYGDKSLAISLKAEKAVKGWMQSATPRLIIQCDKKKVEIYIETIMPLEVTQVDKQIVSVQFDNNKPSRQRWQEIANAAVAANARDSALLIKQFAQSKKFVFEFTPFNSPSVKAEFDISGLEAFQPNLATTCWE